MTRITAKLTDEQREWVEEQAEQRDRSQADIVRAAIDLARGEESPLRSDAQHSTSQHSDELRDRTADLEDRVADLEARLSDLEPVEQWGGADVQDDKLEASRDGLQLTYPQEVADLDVILEGWTPGRTPEEQQARRESGRAVLEWIREQPGAVRASHVKDALYDDVGLEEQSEATWWEQTARGALNHAADRGVVDNSGRTYEWVGDPARSR